MSTRHPQPGHSFVVSNPSGMAVTEISHCQAILHESSDGPALAVTKTTEIPEEGDDGLAVTEWELTQQFDHGIPMALGSPTWSTFQLPYPDVVYTRPQDESLIPFEIPPQRLSIQRQSTRTERTRLSSGSISVTTILTNHYTDGKIENKEIVNDPCKILQEQKMLYSGFKEREHVYGITVTDNAYRALAWTLRQHEEADEDDSN